MPAPRVMIGWTTTASQEEAGLLARGLVDARLAACAQVSGPISSTYRWNGTVETASEWRVTVKFSAAREAEIQTWLATHHPYDTPQWVTCEAAGGAEKYLNWIDENSS